MPLSIKEYLKRGTATSKEIQAATGLSQSGVSRQIRDMGDNIIRLQSGRSPRYAATCNAFGGNDKLPLNMIDAHGNNVIVAFIRPLVHGGFFVESATGMPPLLLGESKDGLYDDLPYFLFDLKPQGFLGRKIAEEMSTISDDFPTDPRRWNTNHIGRYLISNGDDLPGNLKFGEQTILRVKQKPVIASDEEYPALADSVMSGVIPGSSAGGEQPKFTAFSRNSLSHVIVKFSSIGDNAIATRWCDVLITEYYATRVIRAYEFPAAETRLFEMDNRLFLESQRFDRSGEYGRMPMISLQSIDAEFTGLGRAWPTVFDALRKKELVNYQHVFDAKSLWCFGSLINNTDMHLGNVSMAIEGDVFRLLPLYDMCSMGFAPKSGGEISPYNFVPSELKMVDLDEDTISLIKKIAHDFWEMVANDERISGEFKEYLEHGNPIDLM